MAFIALIAWAAYKRSAMLLAGVLLVLLCAGVIAWLVRRAARGRELLHDPAVSTLVFPPESKFQQSRLP